jgi:hypothetical protein
MIRTDQGSVAGDIVFSGCRERNRLGGYRKRERFRQGRDRAGIEFLHRSPLRGTF